MMDEKLYNKTCFLCLSVPATYGSTTLALHSAYFDGHDLRVGRDRGPCIRRIGSETLGSQGICKL